MKAWAVEYKSKNGKWVWAYHYAGESVFLPLAIFPLKSEAKDYAEDDTRRYPESIKNWHVREVTIK